MTSSSIPRLAAVLLLIGVVAAPLSGQPQTTGAGAAVVYLADVDAIIHPISAEFMIQTMDTADAAGAELVVFRLETPGGLVDSTRDIVTHMLAAQTPVAVFVGPAGARAASAGFILTIAADVAAMAPGTHIGAAHPVGAGGDQPDETMAQKAAEDVAAYARTLAEGRGRNVELAAEAVHESRAFTAQEAMDASPPLIDVISPTVPDLLVELDGRVIRRFDGSEVTLRTAGAAIVPVEMGTRQRILSAIAHPQIAFMLLSLGVLGLMVELWSPGAIFPGVVGAVSLVLAFFALQLLPVNYAGVLLLVIGVVLLLLEIAITSFGLLTVGGVICLVLGGMMLIDAPEPELRLDLQFVLPVVLGFVAIAGFLIRLAIQAQRQQATTGASGMVGSVGETLQAIAPGGAGQVRVHGEIWRATSPDEIPAGARVRVSAINGLTLVVSRI